jgi:hypothetical protein
MSAARTTEWAREASKILAGPCWSILAAPQKVESVPGLYAIYAAPGTWAELGLASRNGVPLYVGKSVSSLVTRELEGHFATNPQKAARTGNSTVRRSFGALLHSALDLRARPRGHARKSVFTHTDHRNFELDEAADQRLTAWMHHRLELSVWSMPPGLTFLELGQVEVELIQQWTPPINIRDNPTKDPRLVAARKRMADQARAWRGAV